MALARLLLGAPRLLLLDEPFSNLDRAHKRTMQAIIEEVGTRLGITCLLVSHDATDVLPWADEILVLRRGELVQRFAARWLPALAAGTLRPVIDRTYPLADAAEAHRRMESGANVGKILLLPAARE